MNKPNFLIIGLARSGTTSLYHYLKQHPEIYLAETKEPKYFSSINRKFPHNGKGDDAMDSSRTYNKSDYYNLFEMVDNETAIGEASSDYFFYINECLPEILKELGSETKIIICLRNPYDRAYSAYNNLIRDSRESHSFLTGLQLEKERIRDNYDWMWFYLNGSLYYDKLKKIKDNFDETHIIYFEDLESNASVVLKKVCEFLKIDTKFKFDTETIYSSSGKPKNLFIKYLSRRYGIMFFLRKSILKLISRDILEKISKSFFKKGEMQFEEIDLLRIPLNEDIDKLIILLNNNNLAKWKK